MPRDVGASLRPNELLQAVKAGQTLDDLTLRRIKLELTSSDSTTDRYTLIHILGLAGQVRERDLVAKFLYSPDDPFLSRIALTVLCSYWGFAAEYQSEIGKFVRGVSWDTEEDVRQIAIAIAGRYLRDHADAGLFSLLVGVADDRENSAIIREDAIRALAAAEGEPLPPASRRESVDSDWSRRVLTAARLAVEKGGQS